MILFKRRVFAVVLLACLPFFAIMGEEKNMVADSSKHESAFNMGKYIFEHIQDAYSWHILEFNGHPVSIPLPVILYSGTSGFHFFISNKFHHGETEYNGFKIAEEGPNKNKIVEIMPDGKEVKPIDISITKNVLSLFISVAILLFIFISVGNKYKKFPNKAPSGLLNAVEPFVLFVRDDIARPMIGEKKYEKFMPYLLT